MHYAVTARFKPDTAAEFLRELTDGTIENQKPDGREIVASMQRAVIGSDGLVRWSEVCYCPTPLEHERETVYDRFFSDIETEQVEDYVQFEGESFMDYLERLAVRPWPNKTPEERQRWFEWYSEKLSSESTFAPPSDGRLYRCPCCHCRTLDERGGWDICPVCFWEDDGQDDDDADTVRGGPNHPLSLTKARKNYIEFGACDQRSIKNVRPPTREECS